jgi:organic hydroperoxide reductase OsmC/OhrA
MGFFVGSCFGDLIMEIIATVAWERNGARFIDNKYSRLHKWQFDGGTEVPASSSPHVVRPPLSEPAAVDPEEAFVAALSSCHMLWFLALAAKQGLVVETYTDAAVAEMGRNANGKTFVSRITLRPTVVFAEPKPSAEQFESLHRRAHEECYIANSVNSEVRLEPVAR